jgi:hypothetical protein
MFMYGGKTPKRHAGYSNSEKAGLLATGKLRGWKNAKDANTSTYRTYKDKKGKQRFTGTANLKESQHLGII